MTKRPLRDVEPIFALGSIAICLKYITQPSFESFEIYVSSSLNHSLLYLCVLNISSLLRHNIEFLPHLIKPEKYYSHLFDNL